MKCEQLNLLRTKANVCVLLCYFQYFMFISIYIVFVSVCVCAIDEASPDFMFVGYLMFNDWL